MGASSDRPEDRGGSGGWQQHGFTYGAGERCDKSYLAPVEKGEDLSSINALLHQIRTQGTQGSASEPKK